MMSTMAVMRLAVLAITGALLQECAAAAKAPVRPISVMPALVACIHVFLSLVVCRTRRGWHRNSGLPELRIMGAASRVNPTCGDKPGHDESNLGHAQSISSSRQAD